MLRIFLSHVRDDGVLARRLAESLKRAGHQSLLVEDMARVGDSALEVLERCLQDADGAILCLSRTAISSAWMQTEFQTVLSRLEARGQPVLAVRFERVEAPAHLLHCLSVDLFSQEGAWEEGSATLLRAIERLYSERPPGGGAWRPGNLPPAPEVFVGREESLRQLHEALIPRAEAAGSRRATLVGEEGMGRSATALRFAHEAWERFPGGIWWCEARGRTADEAMARLLPELRRLAPLGIRNLLDPVSVAMPAREIAQSIRQALAQLQAPALLVVDDAGQADWESYLPAGQVSVLLTRSEPEGAVGEVITLPPLTPAESLELVDLLGPIPEEPLEREARSRTVQDLLVGHPQVLTLFAQLQKESEASWALLEQSVSGHLQEALAAGETGHVRTALDEALERCTPAMWQGLEITASFEAAIPVPLEWVIAVAQAEAQELKSDQALSALSLTQLFSLDEERDTVSLHPLVRQRVRERMKPARRELHLRRAMAVMVSWLQSRIPNLRPEKLAEVEEQQPHFQQSLEATKHWPPFNTWVMLALQMSTVLEVRFELRISLEWVKRALVQAKALSAPREELLCLARIARLLHELGQGESAAPYIQQALRLVEVLKLHDDHDFAATLHILASLLRTEDLNQARPLAERALQEAEMLTEPDEVLTGFVLVNLALIHKDAGEPGAALPLLERALELTRRGVGQESSFFAEGLSEQAEVLMALNDWARARTVLEQALAIVERLLPPDHPMIGGVLVRLARALLEIGEFSAAKLHLERAVGIGETKFGPDHPALGGVLNNLGVALARLRQTQEASEVFSRMLRLVQQHRPWDKELLTGAEIRLALASVESGDAQGARVHFEKALDTGLLLYAPEAGPGHDALAKALRLARGRQVNPEAYVSALRETLAAAEQEEDMSNAARAALLLGAFEGRRGAWEAARHQVERALKWAKKADASLLVAESHRLLGDASLHGSRYEDARLHYAEAIRRFEELGLDARAARTRMLLLVMMLQLGRTEGIEAHAAALESALQQGTLTEPAERAEVEQILRLLHAARQGTSHEQRGKTE